MLKSILKKAVLLSVLASLVSSITMAKDLNNRLGIGYSNSFSFNLPSIAAVYYPASNWAWTGALGIDSASNNSSFGATVGIRKIIFTEDNMNFFMGGTVSLVSQSTPTSSTSGFELAALAGGEFFMHGLDNLGLIFDTGVAMSSTSTVRFRTLGESFLNAGIIFYF